jgi:FtsP/CotA-like multicopper oxidase with cupredoxin domain
MATANAGKKSPTKLIIGIIVVVAAGAGGLLLFSQGPGGPSAEPGVKEFQILLVESGPNRAWNPNEITVKVGDKVRLRIVNTDSENPATPTYHRFVLTEYNIDSGDIAPNKEYVVDFVADKAGEFTWFDPRPDEMVGRENVRHSQEKGKLIVEP